MDNQEILDSILDSSDIFKDTDEEILRDYISEESVQAIEYNINFFTNIPKTEIQEVLENLLILIYSYEREIWNTTFPSINLSSSVPQEKTIRPITKISQDLKMLKNYKKMLDRLFNYSKSRDGFFMITTNDAQKDISTLYKINNTLIEDLEKKNFNIIGKSKYYEAKSPSKRKIKDFLKKTREIYNLKGVSLEEKQLVDNIPSHSDNIS